MAHDALQQVLKKYWGFDDYLPLQREAMQCVLDDRDSLVVMPTGGGKSLCFQAPAMCRDGLAVVVSPLLALMKDQVDGLAACGIPAAAVNSTHGDRREAPTSPGRSNRASCGYSTCRPSGWSRRGRSSSSQNQHVSFLRDRRSPLHQRLGARLPAGVPRPATAARAFPERRRSTPTRPRPPSRFAATSSTSSACATPKCWSAISAGRTCSTTSPAASAGSARSASVIDRFRGQSGIVYCITRAEVDKTCAVLREMGYSALPYHAGMSDDDRIRNQDAFLTEQADTIVATIAFGMGIDKSNVRYVIHAGMPKSLENYQQESGRAGRDGVEAECWLLYSGRDLMTWKRLLERHARRSARRGRRPRSKRSTPTRRRSPAGTPASSSTSARRGPRAVQCVRRVPRQARSRRRCARHRPKDSLVRAARAERFGADYVSLVLTGSQEQRIVAAGHDKLSTWGILERIPPAGRAAMDRAARRPGFLWQGGRVSTSSA